MPISGYANMQSPSAKGGWFRAKGGGQMESKMGNWRTESNRTVSHQEATAPNSITHDARPASTNFTTIVWCLCCSIVWLRRVTAT